MSIIIFIIGIISTINVVHAASCTAEQLQGISGSFNLPGGGGNYDPGSSQVVSYSWRNGCSITNIHSVQICQGSACENTGGVLSNLPVAFTSSQPDTGGGIEVKLPVPLSTGSYVFRLALHSSIGNVDCTVDSVGFFVNPVQPNQCTNGESKCVSSTERQSCVTVVGGNVWGPTTSCVVPQICNQNGNIATCSLNTPSSCTVYGKYECMGDSYHICNYVSVNVLQWTEDIPCGVGYTCSPNGDSIQCNVLHLVEV